MTTDMPNSRAPTFFEEVVAATPGDPHLNRCIQCGTCGGSCPSGADMDHTPRHLFAMIDAGMRQQVLSSNTPWYCVSCYYCMTRCPEEVHITDLMYTLKRMAVAEKFFQYSSAADGPEFSETFVDFVENYGRSFELGLVTRFYLRYHPLDAVRKAGLGWGMWQKGRMDLTPTRIKDIDQLKAIMAKARELEGEFDGRRVEEAAL
jgi:heterodisulfide reductase subunit C